jgi:hypothetical protein
MPRRRAMEDRDFAGGPQRTFCPLPFNRREIVNARACVNSEY